MNIFVLDQNPEIAARSLCDKHIVKMIVESCQLLSTHERLENGLGEERYKITHKNHPCRLCLSNGNNFIWLCYHLNAMLNEYTLRYGKVHKCQKLFDKYWAQFLDLTYLPEKLTFPKCMPSEFWVGEEKIGNIEEIVASYKNYYKFKSNSLKQFRYTKRISPQWLMN